MWGGWKLPGFKYVLASVGLMYSLWCILFCSSKNIVKSKKLTDLPNCTSFKGK